MSAEITATFAGALDAVGYNIPGTADADVLGFPSASKLCFVVVDGLGALQLQARHGHAPTLRSLSINRAITTVTPSTTAAALTAITTGEEPGQTSMAGYTMRNDATHEAFSLVSWKGHRLPEPRQWQSCPTLFERLGSRADKARVIVAKKYIGTPFSQAFLRSAHMVPAQSLDERIDAAAQALRSGVDVAYLYWENIDKAGHRNGWNSQAWIDALEELDAGIRSLLRRLPSDTLLVLTADHGMVDVTERIDIAAHQQLRRGIGLVAGEPRALHLYTTEPDDVVRRWSEFLGDKADVLTKSDVASSGLLGPIAEHVNDRLGDVFVLMKGTSVVVDSTTQPSSAINLIGVHGSRTDAEMYVPLIMEVA
ncbi:alkaline phosphatase family protein [Arcanobacterium canis]